MEEYLGIFMKDKSISPPMLLWDSLFNKGVMHYRPPFYKGSRNLLQTVLNNEYIKLEECLHYVESGEYTQIQIACLFH